LNVTLLLVAATLVASAALTGWLRRFAFSRNLIDVPNSRSSHVTPTPRGGGVAIVLVVLMMLPFLTWSGALQLHSMVAMLGAGALVAGIGWLDDHGHVAPRWRLIAQFVGAAWAVAWLGGLPPLTIFGSPLDLGWIGHVLAVVGLVWLLNLYNFMDGIDGIAGIEAVTVCLGGVVLYLLVAEPPLGWIPPLVMAAAVSGFLFWNFPRARIFMGDAGSGFVGLALGLLALDASAASPALIWAWLILLGAFVVDATVTLIRRFVRGERVHEAHRSHAYQQAARRLGSHAPVSIAFGGINLLWLLPISAMVVLGQLDGSIGVVIAYIPLVWLAVREGAGEAESTKLANAGQPSGD
jgi:Fuc2NAc and GlcNAc transferase